MSTPRGNVERPGSPSIWPFSRLLSRETSRQDPMSCARTEAFVTGCSLMGACDCAPDANRVSTIDARKNQPTIEAFCFTNPLFCGDLYIEPPNLHHLPTLLNVLCPMSCASLSLVGRISPQN